VNLHAHVAGARDRLRAAGIPDDEAAIDARLLARLLDMEIRKQQDAIAKDRRSQVGAGDRSEKIRTYNFPQSRITDHRINFTTHRLHDVLEGDPGELVDQLTTFYNAEKLKEATTV